MPYKMQYVHSGRYGKYLPKDVAEKVNEFVHDTLDIRQEEALVQWVIGEFLVAYQNESISLKDLHLNLLPAVETLRRCFDTRTRIAIDTANVITADQLIMVVTTIASFIDKFCSVERERQLIAHAVQDFLEGKMAEVQVQKFTPKELPPPSVEEVIRSAVPNL